MVLDEAALSSWNQEFLHGKGGQGLAGVFGSPSPGVALRGQGGHWAQGAFDDPRVLFQPQILGFYLMNQAGRAAVLHKAGVVDLSLGLRLDLRFAGVFQFLSS